MLSSCLIDLLCRQQRGFEEEGRTLPPYQIIFAVEAHQSLREDSVSIWNKPEEDARSMTSNLAFVTIKIVDTDFLLIDLGDQED
jgi:hypothetical protein